MRKIIFLAGALLLAVTPALAQVQQSGTVTARHPAYWVTSGAIGDPGGATDSALSSLGVTNEGGPGLCVSSQRASAAGRQQLCLSTGTSTGATISLTNLGTAPSAPLSFVIDGTTYPFPGSLANITIGVTPVVGGTNSQCLFVSGGVVGQQACTLSAITSLTGDVTATGPGISAATLATSGVVAGTYGSSIATPVITVDAKGRVTSATTTPAGITVGSTVISSGTTNGLLYANGSVLGNLTTLNNGVLITSAGGAPSISTTLPSALTIPSPTFTGTLTLPDAATWANTGISKVAALSAGSATIPAGGNINVSGQYQVNGSQIAASNLSNGTTGSGAVVLAAAPAISGTWTGSPTFSGNLTFSGQAIETGTSAPASAGGNTVVMGTIAAPTLSNNGQAFLFNTVVGGAFVEGSGSTSDFTLGNKSGAAVFTVPTGTTKLNLPSLSAGTCANGVGLDSGNNTILISCPGAAASIQVGTTSITSGTNGKIEFNNSGLLGELLPAGGVGIVSTSLSATSLVNAQSGTSYAIVDGDRGKLITATNAAAQAYTIAQAGTGGNFASGWFTDIQNNSTNPLGIVTVTATTSTINMNGVSATTFKIFPGQSTRLVSDGPNYQAFNHAQTNQVLQASPGNPTGTTSTAMMGLGSTCTLTPTYSTRIHLSFQGDATDTISGTGITLQARYGTGGAPANGAGATGTTIGSSPRYNASGISNAAPFRAGGNITGLTPGTAYWFDMSVATGAGTASISDVSCDAFEF